MKIKKRFLVLFSIVLIVILFIKSDWIGKFLYPLSYEHEMQQYAKKYELDTQLIAAIIRVESNFKLGQESSKGASGLMQIMPSTADWIIQKAQLEQLSTDRLLNSVESNIELGTWYIDYLLEKYDNEIVPAIAAYNAGPGNVDRWLREKTWDGTFANVDQIPYSETRQYVQKVIYYYNKYKEIYPSL